MIQLNPDQYHLVRPGLEKVDINHLFAKAVIELHADGLVFTDNIDNPRAFYIIHSSGMSMLFGHISKNFLNSHLKDYLLGQNDIRKSDESLQIYPSKLETRLDNMLGENLILPDDIPPDDILLGAINNLDPSKTSIIKDSRTNFKFNSLLFNKFLSKIDLNRYRFLELDTQLYDQIDGSVVPREFWKNADLFILNGKGFSLIYDGQPVAVAFSSFKFGPKLEVGIETNPNYRRQGFAGIACAKIISYCLEENLEPIWACRSSNLGSYNLALKIGFEPQKPVPYYELPPIA